MQNRLHKLLERQALLPANQPLVVAVSGGLDSVVLLDLLASLAQHWGWTLIVAHLNHGQRVEAGSDAEFVGRLADTYGARFVLGHLPKTRQTEAAMRQARYSWLEMVRHEAEAAAIVTAHHRGDRLETAAWHAIRGSDRHGLTSLGVKNGMVVRPLIGFGRGDIVTYAATRQLAWREDASNADRQYTRNLIRHEMMHHAPVVDPYFHNNMSDWLDHLEDLNTRIDTKLTTLLTGLGEEVESGWVINRTLFLQLHPLVQLNLISHMARALTGGQGLTEKNLDAALKWWTSARSGSYSEALPGLLLIREYDKVRFVLRSAALPTAVLPGTQKLPLRSPVQAGSFRLTMHDQPLAQAGLTLLVPNTYFIRAWQPGDRVHPLGMHGSKKVQDVFTDRKVPRSQRLTWPVIVTARNEIALVPNLVRDRRFVPANTLEAAHALQIEVV